jgi:hypothetical protein
MLQRKARLLSNAPPPASMIPLVDDVGGKFGAVFSSVTLTASMIEPTGSARL